MCNITYRNTIWYIYWVNTTYIHSIFMIMWVGNSPRCKRWSCLTQNNLNRSTNYCAVGKKKLNGTYTFRDNEQENLYFCGSLNLTMVKQKKKCLYGKSLKISISIMESTWLHLHPPISCFSASAFTSSLHISVSSLLQVFQVSLNFNECGTWHSEFSCMHMHTLKTSYADMNCVKHIHQMHYESAWLHILF